MRTRGRALVLETKSDEFFLHAFAFLLLQNGLAGKDRLFRQRDEKAEARLQRRPLFGKIVAIERQAGFEAQRVARAEAARFQAKRLARFQQREEEILTARTGYTGEDGIELFFANEIAERFFLALLEAGKPFGLKPCGLGARDTLRLEACLPLNGNDLSSKRTPLEAGLGFFVSLTKEADFPGKAILQKQKSNGVNEKLVAFRLKDKGPPPRPHYRLFLGDEQVGEVTSGAPSPTLGCGIGLAYVDPDYAEPGTTLELEVRGTRVPVEVVKKPFYKRVV